MTGQDRRGERARECARLRVAAEAFAAAGFAAFRPLGADLDRAQALEVALQDRRHAAGEHERVVAERLAAGDLDVDGAAVELAAGVVPRLDETVERALSVLHRQVAQDGARLAVSAFLALVPATAEATAEAVAAGRRCCDVDAVAKAVREVDYRMRVPSLVAEAALRPEWPAAVSASERVEELRRLAGMLPSLGGPAPRFWGRRVIGEPERVGELVPVPLQLAVGAALGWEPGLFESRVPVRDHGDDGRAARVEIMRRAPVLGALRQRLDDLATLGR